MANKTSWTHRPKASWRPCHPFTLPRSTFPLTHLFFYRCSMIKLVLPPHEGLEASPPFCPISPWHRLFIPTYLFLASHVVEFLPLFVEPLQERFWTQPPVPWILFRHSRSLRHAVTDVFSLSLDAPFPDASRASYFAISLWVDSFFAPMFRCGVSPSFFLSLMRFRGRMLWSYRGRTLAGLPVPILSRC